jgi:hypothetical protein
MVALRLPAEVKPVFLSRLREARPNAADKVVSALRQVREGRLYDARFGERMKGSGPRWKAIEDLFALHLRKLGLNDARPEPALEGSFRRPSAQLDLF